jgi:glucose/arabinose dehydrogenase
MNALRFVLPGLLFVPLLAGDAHASVLPPGFIDETIASGLSQPVNFDFLPDGRVLVVERATGCVRLARPGAIFADTVGVVPDLKTEMMEQGLLGIAVDPRWPEKPYIYVHSTCSLGPNIRISRFLLTGDLDGTGDGTLAMDPSSRQEILADLPDDQWLHNGGTILFNPEDGYMYVALGDDAYPCGAQDIHQLRGKILRIDPTVVPDGVGPLPYYDQLVPPGNPFANDADPRARTVWHYGLRNPWSFAFSRNGSMVIGDVGQVSFEEIDIVSTPGRNFGWPLFEGDATYELDCTAGGLESLTMPQLTYPHDPQFPAAIQVAGACTTTGTGPAKGYPGEYLDQVFYYDLYEGKIRRLDSELDHWFPAADVSGQPEPGVWGTGFAGATRMRFHPDGRLWYVQGNSLHRISYSGTVAAAPPGAAGSLELAAFPVPSASGLTFLLRAPAPGPVTIEIHDLAGRTVRKLEGSAGSDGTARFAWDRRDADGRTLPGGVYFARGSGAGERTSRRIVLL